MKEEGFRVTNIDDDNEINVVIQPLSKLSSGDTLPNELDLVKQRPVFEEISVIPFIHDSVVIAKAKNRKTLDKTVKA